MTKTSYDRNLDDVPTVVAQPVEAEITVTPTSTPVVVNNAGTDLRLNHKNRAIDEAALSHLVEQGYSRGFAESLNDMKIEFPGRIWIIDNSGSMRATDGHRAVNVPNGGGMRLVPCSRWEEIQECVGYHVSLAGTLEASTSFRLLNDPGRTVGPQRFSVGENPGRISQDVQDAQSLMLRASPTGCTPLTAHINEIHREVMTLTPGLRYNGQRIAIVIATDGLPTDGSGQSGHSGEGQKREFVQALRQLEGLPVWVVIRLCTDEEDVVDFYNDLDAVLELSIEVLDDFCGEAAEVKKCNPWLNYALPIHRMREFGFHDRVFDMLDERLLTRSELRDFCRLLFGNSKFDGVPDPSLDWDGFVRSIERMLLTETYQWNPLRKRMKPWISVKQLKRCYGSPGCIIL